MDRIEAPGVGDERTALVASLDFQRASVLLKVEGLSDEQLRRPMVPSGTSCLGLVKHLAGVEHWWFVINFGQTGETPLWSTEADPDADMRAEPGETTEEILGIYRTNIERSRRVVAAASLDDRAPNARRGEIDLRWILIHLIEEYCRHLGHLDIMRELLDGATGI